MKPWDHPEIKIELDALIEQARREKKWLWCNYQDLWFSPDHLQALQDEGSYRWGPVNWQLRDPQERLDEAEDVVRRAIETRNRIAQEIKHG